jgi:hypothetical protein
MEIVPIILLVAFGAVFYLPVYLPFLISFKRKHSEVRWALRVSSLVMFAVAIMPLPGMMRDKTGQDIAGSFEAALHNIPILIAWIWGGGFLCHTLALIIGRRVRRSR